MSSVRMCDNDGTIFSENAEGWSTFSGSIRVTDKETHQVRMVNRTMDLCPTCTELRMGGQVPAIATGVDSSYVQEALTDHESRYDHPAARGNG